MPRRNPRRKGKGWFGDQPQHILAGMGVPTKSKAKTSNNDISGDVLETYDNGNIKVVDYGITVTKDSSKKLQEADKILTIEQLGDDWMVYHTASESMVKEFDDKSKLIDWANENPKYKIDNLKTQDSELQHKDLKDLMKKTAHLQRYQVYKLPNVAKINGKPLIVKDEEDAVDLAKRIRKYEDEVIIQKQYTNDTPLNKNEFEKAQEKLGIKEV